jgi:hypothetical protein
LKIDLTAVEVGQKRPRRQFSTGWPSRSSGQLLLNGSTAI